MSSSSTSTPPLIHAMDDFVGSTPIGCMYNIPIKIKILKINKPNYKESRIWLSHYQQDIIQTTNKNC